MCKDCGAQMNADNFLKHDTSRHNGRAKSLDLLQTLHRTLSFAMVNLTFL